MTLAKTSPVVSRVRTNGLVSPDAPHAMCLAAAVPHETAALGGVLVDTLHGHGRGPTTSAPGWGEFAGAFISWFRMRLDETAEHVDSALLSEVLDRSTADGLDASPTESVASQHEDDQPESPQNVPDAATYEATFSYSPHLRAFLTMQKYFGVSSESLRENDEIWIVAGSRVPLALRQAGQGAFRLVGGAYIHGSMHGEVLELGESFREIILV
jgi:hypothetical protein